MLSMTEGNNLAAKPLGGSDFSAIGGMVGGLMKEIRRRAELRQRLDVERGRPISDREFLRVAEETGGMRL